MPDGEVAALVAAARRGDDAAWRALIARYLDLVWAVARAHSLGPTDAADVVQTTWMRLYEQLEKLTDPARVGAWLSTTARREALRVAKERRRQVPSPSPELLSVESYGPAADEACPAGWDGDRLFWEAFAQLSPACQRLLRTLVADPAPSYLLVSEALAMPVGSIGPTRARCLDRLRANILALGRSPAGTGGRRPSLPQLPPPGRGRSGGGGATRREVS